MNLCNKFAENFSDYIEGEISSEQRRDLEKHLSICPECEETIRRLRYVRQSLGRLAPVTTSADFDFRLNQRIRSMAEQKGATYFSSIGFHQWKFAVVGIALVFIALSSFLIMDGEPKNVKLNKFNESSLTPAISEEDETATQEQNNHSNKTTQENTPAKPDSTDQEKKEQLKKNIKYVNEK